MKIVLECLEVLIYEDLELIVYIGRYDKKEKKIKKEKN